MSLPRHPASGAGAMVSLVIALSSGAMAQEAAPLPPAKDIIDRFVEAVGGNAWKEHRSSRLRATVFDHATGFSLTLESLQLYPDMIVRRSLVPGGPAIEMGYHGTVAWSRNPMEGPPRLLTGDEADAMRQLADPTFGLRTSEHIVRSVTLDRSTVDGQECLRVKHTLISGNEITDCYSVATGLLVAYTTRQPSPTGEREVTFLPRDYRDFGGVKQAGTVTARMNGDIMTITLQTWEWDTVDPSEVEPPPEIKALIKPRDRSLFEHLQLGTDR